MAVRIVTVPATSLPLSKALGPFQGFDNESRLAEFPIFVEGCPVEFIEGNAEIVLEEGRTARIIEFTLGTWIA